PGTTPADAKAAAPGDKAGQPAPGTKTTQTGAEAAQAAKKEVAKVQLPGSVVSVGQCLSFGGTQWACLLMAYGLFALPIPFTIWPALVSTILCVPGVAATTSTVFGDYLSGDRHPLLISFLTSYGTIWVIELVAAVVDAILLGIAAYVFYDVYTAGDLYVNEKYRMRRENPPAVQDAPGVLRSDVEGLGNLILERSIPAAVLLGVAAGVAAFAFLLLAIAPPLVNTIIQGVLRRESEEGNKLPRLVKRDDDETTSTPVASTTTTNAPARAVAAVKF
ncbi:MAG: hypothetical protein AB2A00_43695, partial [Myxococcota bacterium]